MNGSPSVHLVDRYKKWKKERLLSKQISSDSGRKESIKMSLDFFAGCVGGCAGVLVGHPLDTIKVHLQTQDPRNPIYRGTWHCMTSIIASDRIAGLYRGITSPMAGIGLVNAIVFGVYGNVQRHFKDPDSLTSHCIAGSVAGLLQSGVCAPMELAKTRMQLQHDTGSGLQHKCPLDCIKHIVRQEGFRGAFKGLGITALRDIPGFASYFASYEYMMRLTSSPNAMHCLVAGGFAGICSWLACYPLDVLKTCVQADGMTAKPKYTGVMDCMRQGYASDGIHFFFRGLASTLIRAFPMNAACFFVVSVVMKLTKETNIDVVVHTADPLMVTMGTRTPLCFVHQHEHMEDNLARQRFLMERSLKAHSTFNEAVHYSEIEELAKEFYPKHSKYYLFEDERERNTGNGNSRERFEC